MIVATPSCITASNVMVHPYALIGECQRVSEMRCTAAGPTGQVLRTTPVQRKARAQVELASHAMVATTDRMELGLALGNTIGQPPQRAV